MKRPSFPRLLGLLLCLLLLLLLLAVPLLALQRDPALPAAQRAGEERLAVQARLLWNQLRPGAAPAGAMRHTVLSERDLNALLEQAGQAQGDRWRARLALQKDAATLRASTQKAGFWLNLALDWDLSARDDGQLPPLVRARLGRLPLPPAFVRWAVETAAQRHPQGHWLQALPQLRPMLESWQAGPGVLVLRWRWQPAQAAQALGAMLPLPDREALLAQRAHLRTWLAAWASEQALPLQQLWQAMAQHGVQRVQRGTDPTTELRALMLNTTLYLLGRDIAQWLPEARAQGPIKPVLVLLDGRDDMPMHLMLSAVLAWEGGERASAALGLAKELADRRVGSGFSFTDLAADEAGTRLGLLAERQPQALLVRMAQGLAQAEFFPEVADLPEFLSDPEFRARYGRVGSPAYQAEMARIRARVTALPLLAGIP